jgi:hypothetical protein
MVAISASIAAKVSLEFAELTEVSLEHKDVNMS